MLVFSFSFCLQSENMDPIDATDEWWGSHNFWFLRLLVCSFCYFVVFYFSSWHHLKNTPSPGGGGRRQGHLTQKCFLWEEHCPGSGWREEHCFNTPMYWQLSYSLPLQFNHFHAPSLVKCPSFPHHGNGSFSTDWLPSCWEAMIQPEPVCSGSVMVTT